MTKYMISTYCSSYGPNDVCMVNTIDDIVKYIVTYIIYQYRIYTTKFFNINNIPTTQSIEKSINENEYLDNNFGPKEILLYKGTSPSNDIYYATIKIMKDIEILDFDDISDIYVMIKNNI